MGASILILDSNSILHRTFHALPLLSTKEGTFTNAVYGFCLMLFRALKECDPQFVFACFDFPAKTFRHLKFKQYKIHRPKTPEELKTQISLTKELLKNLNVQVLEKEGFEADDIIGTLCERLKDKEKLVLSGDYDNLQLVDEKTKVWVISSSPKEVLLFDEKKIKEKFGILPQFLPDFKALVGDPSDNVPGVPGIGPKTAQRLIQQYGSVETIFENLSQIDKKLQDILQREKEKIFFNKSLCQIRKDVPLEINWHQAEWKKFDPEKLISFFEKLEFKSLIKRIPELKTSSQKNLPQKTLF